MNTEQVSGPRAIVTILAVLALYAAAAWIALGVG